MDIFFSRYGLLYKLVVLKFRVCFYVLTVFAIVQDDNLWLFDFCLTQIFFKSLDCLNDFSKIVEKVIGVEDKDTLQCPVLNRMVYQDHLNDRIFYGKYRQVLDRKGKFIDGVAENHSLNHILSYMDNNFWARFGSKCL